MTKRHDSTDRSTGESRHVHQGHWMMKPASWQSLDATSDPDLASVCFHLNMKFPPLGPKRSRP
jgi:hypothetical protein